MAKTTANVSNDVAKKEDIEVTKKMADQIVVEQMTTRTWDEDTLRNIASFDDAMALVEREYGPVVAVDEVLGDGFSRVEDKTGLVGLPILFMEWNFYRGDFGTFVAVRALAKGTQGQTMKVMFIDGSAGICEDLARYTLKTGKTGGLVAKRGLRVSEYMYYDDKLNKEIPAKTFYIDLSA